MQAIFVDDRLDLGEFGDLVDQGVGVIADERVAAAAAGAGLTLGGGVELLGRDQSAEGLGMTGLSSEFPPGRRLRQLAFDADRVGGGWLGRIGGVELEPGLKIADLGFERGDPILERFPGVPEGGLGIRGHGAPEWFRDRKLVIHI